MNVLCLLYQCVRERVFDVLCFNKTCENIINNLKKL